MMQHPIENVPATIYVNGDNAPGTVSANLVPQPDGRPLWQGKLTMARARVGNTSISPGMTGVEAEFNNGRYRLAITGVNTPASFTGPSDPAEIYFVESKPV
jgi:hypothetical protein